MLHFEALVGIILFLGIADLHGGRMAGVWYSFNMDIASAFVAHNGVFIGNAFATA